ncbi:Crp/Fnr family transcriptional regulator [Nonomuraea sp. SYSU D8015]|uniref:Crp/Fnr family transcriptional regulator n=1 Tax=Nonomuraea sp. SYSU D8015 TaxID=2593644 RepID=UPI001CB710D3|nr:Crp/Fnr family transcriptional regulator [Nonomuraea sp. SYSU D8015]
MSAELIELGTTLTTLDGTRLIRQGEPGTLVYLILHGLAKITIWAENGERALLAVRVSGDVIGEMAVLGSGRRSADVTTCGRASLCEIRGDAFVGYMQRHPSVAFALSGLLSDRLRWANQRRLEFAGYAADVCLARIILALAVRHGRAVREGVDIGLPLTQGELGSLIGAKEPTVQKALRALSARGLILRGHRRVVIQDMDGLTRFADYNPRNP